MMEHVVMCLSVRDENGMELYGKGVNSFVADIGRHKQFATGGHARQRCSASVMHESISG